MNEFSYNASLYCYEQTVDVRRFILSDNDERNEPKNFILVRRADRVSFLIVASQSRIRLRGWKSLARWKKRSTGAGGKEFTDAISLFRLSPKSANFYGELPRVGVNQHLEPYWSSGIIAIHSTPPRPYNAFSFSFPMTKASRIIYSFLQTNFQILI